jgi:hypothetical protein
MVSKISRVWVSVGKSQTWKAHKDVAVSLSDGKEEKIATG